MNAEELDSDEPLNDLYNARQLAEIFGDRLCRVPGVGWYAFDGKRWATGRQGEGLFNSFSHQLGSAFTERSVTLWRSGAIERATKLRRWAASCGTAYRLRAVQSIARDLPELWAEVDDFDASLHLFNFQNGTVDLTTGELRPHDAADRLTCIAPFDFDPTAPCDTWLRFLDAALSDPEVVAWMQRLLGYGMSGETEASVVPLFHGSGGNGKSVLLSAVAHALGSDYAAPADMRTFVSGNRTSGHSADLAAVATKRFVFATEGERGDKMAASVVKLVTGGERMSASFKGQNPFSFTPRFLVVFATNFAPKVFGDDQGVWRRLRKVPFPNTLTKEAWPKAETEALLRAEAPGILAWMVRGAVAYYADGLREPEAITAATAEYRTTQDFLADFLGAVIVQSPGGWMRNTEVWDLYERWCEAQGQDPVNTRHGLYSAMTDRGFRQVTRDGYKGFTGIAPALPGAPR